MTEIPPWVVPALLAVVLVGLALVLLRLSRVDAQGLAARLEAVEKGQERGESALRQEMAISREELGKAIREQRQELTDSFRTLGESLTGHMRDVAEMQKGQLADFSDRLSALAKNSADSLDAIRRDLAEGTRQLGEGVGGQLDALRRETAQSAVALRKEIIEALTGITASTTNTMGEMASIQKAQLESMATQIANLAQATEKKLEALKGAVETRLENMRVDNAAQLERMRQTVDEKLQDTLEKRLGESFHHVSERLERVHKSLGEIQTLATGVGDLKKVLTNVKTRGTWGEVQLGALLDQVLSPEQYAANFAPKDGGERVEYAIRLPGQGEDGGQAVWLPMDAKFPLEDYQRLLDAQERADKEAADAAGRQLEARVKACAADICRKYINAPKTTDFAILFLPIEGLFAEVIRRPGLADTIQRECKVVIAGPTTLWSLLNSLQMGFRTLAIQKRSSEVWELLGAVKTEWTKFGATLEKVQSKLEQASKTVEEAHKRSKAVGRKLKDVQELPVGQAAALLPGALLDVDEAAEDDKS